MSEEQNIDQSADNSQRSKENENISEENIQHTALDTQHQENMEVHKHPHHVTHKKKWTEYLLEFFMLFLAVFLGFVAENIREHSVEQEREKQYLKSMKDDLIKDTGMLTPTIQRAITVTRYIDTTIDIIQSKNNDPVSVTTLYRDNLKTLSYIGTAFTDRTSVQLKNAGAMRLVRRLAVADGIINYWSQIESLKSINEIAEDYKRAARDKSYSLFDQKYYSKTGNYNVKPVNPKLMSNNLIQITEFGNRLSHIRSLILNVYVPALQLQEVNARNLIQLINKEYHLE